MRQVLKKNLILKRTVIINRNRKTHEFVIHL